MELARWTRVAARRSALTLALAPALARRRTPRQRPAQRLRPGLHDAGLALQGMRLVSATPKAAAFDSLRGLTFVNSDLAFRGNYVYQGNFAGFSSGT
jgi:hypothetical protein